MKPFLISIVIVFMAVLSGIFNSWDMFAGAYLPCRRVWEYADMGNPLFQACLRSSSILEISTSSKFVLALLDET